jgi:hypothetical protein
MPNWQLFREANRRTQVGEVCRALAALAAEKS